MFLSYHFESITTFIESINSEHSSTKAWLDIGLFSNKAVHLYNSLD